MKPRTIEYKGNKHRLYLYKVGFAPEYEDEEMAWTLAISGLYPSNKKELEQTVRYTVVGRQGLTDDNFEEVYNSLLERAKKREERRLERKKAMEEKEAEEKAKAD